MKKMLSLTLALSCVFGLCACGNTWRPDDYELAEEKVQLLQQCAHQAVENMKAGKY